MVSCLNLVTCLNLSYSDKSPVSLCVLEEWVCMCVLCTVTLESIQG